MKIIGIDPGLKFTGWGIIEAEGNRLLHIANGVIKTSASKSASERLVEIAYGLDEVIKTNQVDAAAVEETFVNPKNPASALKLGQARGVALLVPAQAGVPVFEYSATLVKKSVVGTGHADKSQIQMMVQTLLPGSVAQNADAADALAVAICHAHHGLTQKNITRQLAGAV